MKILMIAPEPFFQPRGTPFSEYYRIKCLTEQGHTVDLVTYHIGEDVEIPGLRIIRAPRIPGINDVRIGPSLEKLPLDAVLFFKAWQVLNSGEYDAIHSHEEGGLMAVVLSRMYGLPHVYDMHSSLPDQLKTFKFSNNRLLIAAFDWIERTMLRNSEEVIAICPSLVDKVRAMEQRAPVTLIENVAESHQVDDVPEADVRSLRQSLNLEGRKVILYLGTFEVYQGLGMLLESAVEVFRNQPDALLLLVGGQPRQVEEVRAQAQALGIGDKCRFTGRVPHHEVPPYLKVADVLVSPRNRGDNTPLKIYSYLRSGRPIVATDLYTHTQVLNADVAELAPAEPKPFAEAVCRVLENPDHGKRLAANAFALSEAQYSYPIYARRTRELYQRIENRMHVR